MESRAQKLDRIDIFRSDHAVVAIYNLGSEDLAIDDLQTRRIWRCRRPDRSLRSDLALSTLRANRSAGSDIAPITFGSGVVCFASLSGQALRSDRACVAFRALRARFAEFTLGTLGTPRSCSSNWASWALRTGRPFRSWLSGFTLRTNKPLKSSLAHITFRTGRTYRTGRTLRTDLSNGARLTHGTGLPRFALGTGASERQSKNRKNDEERGNRATTDPLTEVYLVLEHLDLGSESQSVQLCAERKG